MKCIRKITRKQEGKSGKLGGNKISAASLRFDWAGEGISILLDIVAPYPREIYSMAVEGRREGRKESAWVKSWRGLSSIKTVAAGIDFSLANAEAKK